MRIGYIGQEDEMMQLKFLAAAAFAAVLVPSVAVAQGKATKDSATTSKTVSTVSGGDVAGPGAEVTPAMLKAQENPNMIGTPAWWKTHVTADGKPLSDARKW